MSSLAVLRAALDASPVATRILRRADRRLVYANRRYLELFGIAEEALADLTPNMLYRNHRHRRPTLADANRWRHSADDLGDFPVLRGRRRGPGRGMVLRRHRATRALQLSALQFAGNRLQL
ncbi:MAG: PAS domain-containing protein [Betaproteobacteria bacterium]|nr:PAS domain-containing protein [Betaproteobacteria bacterium]